jgi:hypothetical protein
MSIIPAAAEPYVIYVKLAVFLGVIAAAATAGFHFGGLSKDDELNRYKTDVEAQHAAQLKAVADVYQKQLVDAQAHALTQQGVTDDLNKKLEGSGSVASGLAQRMLDDQAAAAAAACNRPVPKGGAVAGAAAGSAGVPRGDPEAVRLLQGALDAGTRDADRLRAAQALSPNPPKQP